MRLRLNLKTACTTTMPPEFIDIIYWSVSAVVLVLMLFTKWGPSNNQNLTDGRTDGRTDGQTDGHMDRQTEIIIGYTQPA